MKTGALMEQGMTISDENKATAFSKERAPMIGHELFGNKGVKRGMYVANQSVYAAKRGVLKGSL